MTHPSRQAGHHGLLFPCRCRQLLSEQEVQARAADAARANVEAHYVYICGVYQDFLAR